MDLAVQSISTDPIRKIATVTLSSVLDALPQVTVTVKHVIAAEQTQAEIQAALRHEVRDLLQNAIHSIERFEDR